MALPAFIYLRTGEKPFSREKRDVKSMRYFSLINSGDYYY